MFSTCVASTRFRVVAPPYGASRLHSFDKPLSAGLIWANVQPDAETTHDTQNSKETRIHAPFGIRAHNPSKPGIENSHLRPRGHWDRQVHIFCNNNRNIHNYQNSFSHLPKSLQIKTAKVQIFTFYIPCTMLCHFNTIIRPIIPP